MKKEEHLLQILQQLYDRHFSAKTAQEAILRLFDVSGQLPLSDEDAKRLQDEDDEMFKIENYPKK